MRNNVQLANIAFNSSNPYKLLIGEFRKPLLGYLCQKIRQILADEVVTESNLMLLGLVLQCTNETPISII